MNHPKSWLSFLLGLKLVMPPRESHSPFLNFRFLIVTIEGLGPYGSSSKGH